MCHSFITFQGFRGCSGLRFSRGSVLMLSSSKIFQEKGPIQIPKNAAGTQLDYSLFCMFLIAKAAKLPKTTFFFFF